MNLQQSLNAVNLLGIQGLGSLRDPVFYEVLGLFGDKPVKIFQVGAVETFNPSHLVGSGWSDRHFGPHVKRHGGMYSVLDIDLDHLANSLLLSRMLNYDVHVVLGDGKVQVQPGYDLYYLDGSNDPDEMLAEVESIRNHPCVILCDDWHIKGTLVKSLLPWREFPVANGMALADLRSTPPCPV